MHFMDPNTVKVSPRHKALVTPYREDIARLLPMSKQIDYEGEPLLAMPHTDDTAQLLRNMGVDCPAPITLFYDWGHTTPFATQVETAALLTSYTRAYVLNEMGTGKTRASLYAYDYLRRQGRAERALVVAPLSTLSVVWAAEVFKYFPDLTCGVLHGTKKRRQRILSQDHHIYVINHDGVKVLLDDLNARQDIDTIIIDELAVFRTQRTNRWKAMRSLLPKRAYVWGLTGQPTPNAPTDAWAQCRLITPDNVPKSFLAFRDQTMFRVSQFTWKPRKTAVETVHKAMQPSVRFRLDECVDLPPVIHSTREVKMTAKQTVVEKALMDTFRAEFAEGKVTAANEGVKLNKLLQVSAGFIYLSDGRPVHIPNLDRMKVVQEVVESAEAKVIIFAPYIELVSMISKHLTKNKMSHAEVTGQTSKRQRDQIFTAFQHTSKYHTLVAHPGTMAHGLTLTSANVVCWASPPPSLEIYEQANARVSRPGQKLHQLIVHIQSSKVEEKVYKRLQERARLQGLLLSLFQGVQHV